MLKGYQMPRYGADGDFGSETADAIKQFRVDNNLRISDKCDAECWERILKG
jgi:peptidoglycan hydrolase-like protein with peptidoglycan-binding domain